MLDAGAVLGGIYFAASKNSFPGITENQNFSLEGTIFRHHIQAYLISNAHLDHVAALVMNSPLDIKKPIYWNQQHDR